MLQVVNFLQATSQLAQTRLRSVLGQHELDEILSQRESINRTLQTILDEATDPWGIKVANVEIKDVDLNETMVRAIARQAEAERERRAKVIHAEGEMQVAEKLRDAAAMLSQQPQALQCCATCRLWPTCPATANLRSSCFRCRWILSSR